MWKVIVGSKGKVRRITGPWEKNFLKDYHCFNEFRDGKPVIG